MLTLGRLDKAYDRLTSHIQKGQIVLDIGCGTGAWTLRAAQKGARVKGIDVNAQMLEIAQKRAKEAHLLGNIELCEMGVAELDHEPSETYDIVMSGLCFSELTEDEQSYALKQAKRTLKVGGRLLMADEVRPHSLPKRILHGLIKSPLAVVTYLITQTTTRAVKNLPEKMEKAGWLIESIRFSTMESFIEVVARKPTEEAP